MPEIKLSLRDVIKTFGSQRVLDGINLDVTKDEMVCLIGASGSGKSTLLRCCNLLEPIDDGYIYLGDQDISDPEIDPRPVRQRLGIVFQTYNLFPHMTALANVMLAPKRIHKTPTAELQEKAEKLFKQFGLADHMHKYPDQLSGGQQQRVAIVRALAMEPEVLLFDEITSALDPELVGEVLEILSQLKAEGRTMILATHEMDFARQFADRVCFLDNGKIIEEGTPAEIFDNPKQPRTKEFLANYISGR